MAKAVVLDPLPAVQLLEDITRESAARVIQDLSFFKGRRVALEIFSNGGDVHGSQAVAAYISNPANGLEVEARIYGNAASGAMIIAAACQKAYIAEGAFALIHKARAVKDGVVVPESELPKEEKAVIDAMNADQVDLFKKRTSKSAAQIEKLMDQDRDMPADEAVEFGLFDGIIPQAMRIAAYKNINTMSEQKKTRAFKVKVARTLDNITAMATGDEVEVHIPEEAIATADAEKVAEGDKRIAELEKELADLKAAKEASDKAKTDAEAVTAAEVEAKKKLENDLKAANDKATSFEVAIEALKKNPLVAQTLPDGTQVVIPGGGANNEGASLTKDEKTYKGALDALAAYDARKKAMNN